MEERVLDMPMRKVHALEILKGEKVREYRAFTDHWAVRICEFNDPDDKDAATGIRHFDAVHFHPYNKSWYLDVEVEAIDIYDVNEDFINDVGGEVDVEIGDTVIVISLGKVIATNLSINP